MEVMENAMLQHRKAIERLYVGKCNVYVYEDVKDPVTKVTSKKEVLKISSQPCKLSFTSIASADNQDGVATVSQTPKLFIAPEVEIKPGSKVEVTQNGKTTLYQRTGEPGRFTTHQEIALELFTKYT